MLKSTNASQKHGYSYEKYGPLIAAPRSSVALHPARLPGCRGPNAAVRAFDPRAVVLGVALFLLGPYLQKNQVHHRRGHDRQGAPAGDQEGAEEGEDGKQASRNRRD